jgi:hypothetical protein
MPSPGQKRLLQDAGVKETSFEYGVPGSPGGQKFICILDFLITVTFITNFSLFSSVH